MRLVVYVFVGRATCPFRMARLLQLRKGMEMERAPRSGRIPAALSKAPKVQGLFIVMMPLSTQAHAHIWPPAVISHSPLSGLRRTHKKFPYNGAAGREIAQRFSNGRPYIGPYQYIVAT